MILVTADLHLTINPLEAYRHAFQKRLRKLVKKYDVDRVVIAGDLTEVKDGHPAWLVNAVVGHLHALAKLVPVIVLLGNHDFGSRASPYWAFVGKLEGVTWISAVTVVNFDDLGSTLFLPHTADFKHDWDPQHIRNFAYVFAHNTFEGANSGSGHRLPGIPVDLFDHGQRIVSGDVHVPQSLGPVTYAGAPYTIDFGDAFAPRVLLLDGRSIRSIRVGGQQKRLIEVRNGRETWRGEPPKAGDLVKIRVHVKPKDYGRWPEIREQWSDWGYREGLQVVRVVPQVEHAPQERVIPMVENRAPQSDKQLLRRYGQTKAVDQETLDLGFKIMGG